MTIKKMTIPIELLFSLVIVAVVVTIITLICVDLNKQIQHVNKNIEATVIATNILENINSRAYDGLNEYIQNLAGTGVQKKINESTQNIIIDGSQYDENFFGTEIPKDYIIDFTAVRSSENFDIVKEVNIIVRYKVFNEEEKFEISSAIERENIEECNSPVISDTYFQELNFNSDEYDIIPIKFSKALGNFVTTNTNDSEWYNYSAKKWTKVLIFSRDADNIKDLFIDENGNIKSSVNYDNIVLDVTNYIYVWIPNFSIKDDVTYFRYGTSKRAIKMDFQYLNGKYLYLNRVGEEISNISDDCSFDGIYGVWTKLGDESNIYYQNFNKTKYAPINIY